MLAITDADSQSPAVQALFDTIDQVGNDPDGARTTTALLERLVLLGGVEADVREFVDEAVMEPWALNVWPMLSGQHVAAHVEHEPRYPAAARRHPAAVSAEERHAPSTAEITSMAALIADEEEPERTVSVAHVIDPTPMEVEHVMTGEIAVQEVQEVPEPQPAKAAPKPRAPRKRAPAKTPAAK